MYYGADFTSLEEIEALGGKFYLDGKADDFIAIIKRCGFNSARLRLWVDPFGSDGKPYGAGVCDIDCVLRLAMRVKAAGMSFMLDLHYSDYWADPAKQCIPKAWRGLDINQLCVKVYDYTKGVLEKFISEGLEPEFIQTGNEITNGMLWPIGKLEWDEKLKGRVGYDNLCAILKAATTAVRETSSAKIVLHLENSSNNSIWREWFDHITAAKIDFDIIGASFYPFWHGSVDSVEANLNDMAIRYGKEIHIVEIAYPFTDDNVIDGVECNFSIDSRKERFEGGAVPCEYTPKGQRDFLKMANDMMKRIHGGLCKGMWYWEPGWLPVKGSSWASEDARIYINEKDKPGGNEWANQCLFDYGGNANLALSYFTMLTQN